MAVPCSLPSLPEELIQLITQHLDATDIVLCRFVSKTWYAVFANPYFLRTALKSHLGNAREVRRLRCEGALTGPIGSTGRDPAYWVHTFDRVAARYHNLKNGTPQYITSLRPYGMASGGWPGHHFPIFPWDEVYRSASIADGSVYLEQAEQAWTYDDGLLVYADRRDRCYVLLDIQDATKANVPFELHGRCIRRIRLCHQVLLIEWAEDTPYHNLNDIESVHRHFVTAFDVELVPKSLPWLPKWSVTYRNEWKLHFLGLSLTKLDRFFSVHTATHYAVYIWQPNRSAWGEDTPLELLAVWDIRQRSDYRPSDDPSGQGRPELGPRVMLKASYMLLDFYGIRQRDNPRFQKLRLDEGDGMVYFHQGEGLSGSGNLSDDSDRSWKYKGSIVGIPFIGLGPSWRSEVAQSRHNSTKEQPAISSFSFPDIETTTEPMQAYERNRCEDFRWTHDGARLRGYRDCSAAINFVAGEPDHEQDNPTDWIIHIWGDGWNAPVKGSALKCLKYSRIRGDERWIIGRNQRSNEIVILHFDKKPSTSKFYFALCSMESTADMNQTLKI